jgi:chromosome segregation ATPase
VPRLPRRPLSRLKRTRPLPTAAGRPEPATGEHPEGQGLDGIRAWLAQLDRHLRLRTLAGAAIGLVALVAAGAGIYLALDAKDEAATVSDINEVRTKITEVEQAALRAACEDVESFRTRVDNLEALIRSQQAAGRRNRSELQVAGDDISDLRRQISALRGQIADLEAEVATKADKEPGNTGGTD